MKKILIILLIINSCTYPELTFDKLVYENNFEGENFENIDGAGTTYFLNSKVLGNYNNDGFTFHLDNVENHDYVFISFDLFIHGSWDGNSNGFQINDQADKWIIEFKPNMDLYNDSHSNKFITTFSNSPCFSNYCLRQSYPDSYPTENIPKLGSYNSELDEICSNSFFGGPTTHYKIERTFKSSGKAVVFSIYDELYQPNAIDKNGTPQSKCDESWSIDNLRVRILKYN